MGSLYNLRVYVYYYEPRPNYKRCSHIIHRTLFIICRNRSTGEHIFLLCFIWPSSSDCTCFPQSIFPQRIVCVVIRPLIPVCGVAFVGISVESYGQESTSLLVFVPGGRRYCRSGISYLQSGETYVLTIMCKRFILYMIYHI